jgi:hypothetical protein
VQYVTCSAVGYHHASLTLWSSAQPVEKRIRNLMLKIEVSFATQRLALIIDDVWDFEMLNRLHLPMGGSSSLMVTSRALRHISTVEYCNFSITGESNRAQEQAILASYVAQNPAARFLPADLQVQL